MKTSCAIQSILDNDLYKFSQQQAVLELHSDSYATYRFINRRKSDKLGFLATIISNNIEHHMTQATMSDQEAAWLRKACPFLKPAYIEYLKNYRFDPSEISILQCTQEGDLDITIKGPWHSAILWEVPLMALISECYFEYFKDQWHFDVADQSEHMNSKGNILSRQGCKFADFGTRRRRSYCVQDLLVSNLKHSLNFIGTSNVELAYTHHVKPIGTMSHEFIQAHSVLCGLRHANRYAFEAWNKVYNGSLGIALSDTFGSEAFFEDFVDVLAHTFDGIRHDSGCPFEFADRVIRHYDELGISSLSKTIVFSDGLTTKKAIEIQKYCDKRKIKCSFGIGTHFTNDFKSLLPLNMVIKMVELDGTPVVKLSDDRGKEIGDPEALRVAKWTFFGTSLDEKEAQ